jgi:hypothetical protein
MWRRAMHKNLISLYELQLHVKSLSNIDNERVRAFLDEVFKIGFTNHVSDIFPMDDFLYGDFLMLDKELLYKEFLDFLKDNEEIDDVLYYIAENNYEKFNSICLPSVQYIDDISKIYKTTKETDEESNISTEETDHSFEMHNTILPEYEQEENKGFLNEDFIKLIKDKKERKDFLNEYFYRKIREEKELDEVNNIENQSNDKSEPVNITYIHTDILEKMEINTNDHLKYNVYARMRIEEYVNEIGTLRNTLSSVFSN